MLKKARSIITSSFFHNIISNNKKSLIERSDLKSLRIHRQD